MKKVQRIYPYIDEMHEVRYDLDYHYGVRVEIEDGKEVEYERYKIKQVETGRIYDEAIDKMPCAYTYECTDELVNKIHETLDNDN